MSTAASQSVIIATMMRRMSDDELAQIAIQSSYFNGVTAAASKKKAVAAAPVVDGTRTKKTAKKAAVAAKPKNGKRAPRATAEERSEFLEKVFVAVKENPGLASSEIGVKAGVEGSRLVTALRQLKNDKRICQGGKLRFTRYATSQKAADAASSKAKGKK
jgi:hypothetical protein